MYQNYHFLETRLDHKCVTVVKGLDLKTSSYEFDLD